MSYTKNSSNYHDYMDRWYSNSYEEYMDFRYWQEEQKKKRWYNRLWAKLTAMADWFDGTFGWFFSPRRYQ